jgi:hypothetical protein
MNHHGAELARADAPGAAIAGLLVNRYHARVLILRQSVTWAGSHTRGLFTMPARNSQIDQRT